MRYIGDPVLRAKTAAVKKVTADVKRLIADMFETMEKEEGAGLAAPQVGVAKKLIVYDVAVDDQGGRSRRALLNPEIVAYSDERLEKDEGCLSLPGLHLAVSRARMVKIRALDEKGRKVGFEAEDLEARVLQHEIDHLNGVFFSDRAGLPEPIARREVETFLAERDVSGVKHTAGEL